MEVWHLTPDARRVPQRVTPGDRGLPCRISVFEQEGKIKIGMIKPTFLLSVFPHGEELKAEAEGVEQDTVRMIEEAR